MRVLFLGATGYVGGTVLSQFMHKSGHTYTVLVRSKDKAARLEVLDGVNIVQGSTEDADLVKRLADDADVVIHTIDSDALEPVLAILEGLKQRYLRTGSVSSFIHTSSTGDINASQLAEIRTNFQSAILCDDAQGMYASNIVHSDLDTEYINALPETTIHRNVDKSIIEADAQGYIRSFIVLPSFVFGSLTGRVYDTGAQNQDATVALWLKMAVESRGPRVIGRGENLWGCVHNADLAEVYEHIFDNMSTASHGRDGYYFATSGEFTMNEYARIIGEVMCTRGMCIKEDSLPRAFSEEQCKKYFTPLNHQVMGGNSRGYAARSIDLGWSPKLSSTESLWAYMRGEVGCCLDDPSRMDINPAAVMTPSLVSN